MGSRLVATCWAPQVGDLLASVRRAAESLNAAAAPPTGIGHLVEARLDLLAQPADEADLLRLSAAAPSRLLVTCRPGGSGSPGARGERHALLRRAVASGAVAVDVEVEGEPPPDLSARLVILSHHENPDAPELTAATARERVGALVAAATSLSARRGPGGTALTPASEPTIILKLAAPARSAAAGLALARAAEGLPAGVGWAPVGLGPGGRWLRILAGRPAIGQARPLSALAYCAEGALLPRTAPGPPGGLGQLRLADMLGPFRVPHVSATTRVFGVSGWPLDATWSPLLHSTLFARRGMDAVFVPLPCRDVAEIEVLRDALGLEGLAVTMPHKASVRALGAAESPAVRRSGTVNSLRRRGERWEAESFDGAAVAALLREHVALDGARVLILGAGGAARAAAAELVAAGARVTLAARRQEQAAEAASVVRAGASPRGMDAVGVARVEELGRMEFDALVQATPCGGVTSAPWDIPVASLSAPILLDMVSAPATTGLVSRARADGRVAVDGLAMLAHQAAAQQAWWSEGLAPMPSGEVERVLRGLVADHQPDGD